MFPAWSESLELSYIEEKIMPGLVARKEKCLDLIARVTEAATGKKTDMGMTGTMHNLD